MPKQLDLHLILNAMALATEVHEGVYRKYFEPKIPYITHPEEVARRVTNLDLPHPTLSTAVAAAWLHDTLEDGFADGTALHAEEITAVTNKEVTRLVLELTNPSKGSDLNRVHRKKMDREHLAHVSDVAKLIKLIDRTCNLPQLILAPVDFRALYVGESELLLEAIGVVDHPDYETLIAEFKSALSVLRTSL